MSGIEKRIKKHACIFVKDLSFISVRYNIKAATSASSFKRLMKSFLRDRQNEFKS